VSLIYVFLLFLSTIDYLESGDSKFLSLMLRFQTLDDSNRELFDRLISSADKVVNLTCLVLNCE
jgi:hypothetical protein